MNYLDTVALVLGYVMMLFGGIYCVGRLIGAAAYMMFKNIKRNSRLLEYFIFRSKGNSSTEARN